MANVTDGPIDQIFVFVWNPVLSFARCTVLGYLKLCTDIAVRYNWLVISGKWATLLLDTLCGVPSSSKVVVFICTLAIEDVLVVLDRSL